MASSRLTDEQFAAVVRLTPLVSIDLVIRDSEKKIFLGRRINAPARHFYFVPGGCIRKHESIQDAFARILYAETGCQVPIGNAHFLGVFEHFYLDDWYGRDSGTHYIVLAYELSFGERPNIVLDEQHSASRWMTASELLAAGDVHDYTKAYFVARTGSRSKSALPEHLRGNLHCK